MQCSAIQVVGSLRTQGEKKHVMAFKVSAISCMTEVDAHLLQVSSSVIESSDFWHLELICAIHSPPS